MRRMFLLAAVCSSLAGCASNSNNPAAQPGSSPKADNRTESWELSGSKMTPSCPVNWSVRKYPLHGGKQEGVDVILVDNGKLQMLIVPTRGMGILWVRLGDVRLGWDSPVKEVVNPAFINLQTRGGLGWLEGFNEWMCRCGLEYAGHPGTDKFINNVGEEATMDLTLHGRIANLPAQEVQVSVDPQAPYRIHVRGRVSERMFYGPKLELETDISTEPGSNAFRIEDVVTNHGASDQEFELLYHTNYGKPLLEEAATFAAPIRKMTPFNANAAKGIKDYARYAGPTLGFIEQVYCITPLADENGKTLAMLENRSKDRAVSLEWSPQKLPFLTLWKNTAAEGDGYVTGLEPGTDFPWNRRIERQAGRVQKLPPGKSHHVAIDVAIHDSADSVQRVAQRIQAIQKDHEPTVDAEAPQVD